MSIDLKFNAQIDRPVDEVCAAVSDLNNMPKWFSIKEVRNISEGPLQVGTHFQVVTEIMGSDQVIDYQVTDYVPCEIFGCQSDGAFPTQITLTLNPMDEGTNLTLEFIAKISGLLAPVMKGQLRKQVADDLNNFVESVESEQ